MSVKKCAKETEPNITLGISNERLNCALEYWIKYTQAKYFAKDIYEIMNHGAVTKESELLTLKPLLDEHGIVRVWGRIEAAHVSYDEKHPIIIPAHCHFARLLMHEAHDKTKHGNVQIMVHYVKTKYWLI